MNDQIKPQGQKDVPPFLAAGVKSPMMGRRRLAKFALGTPVLMTLASRPVLAGQCLSNMMSGNTSPGHVQGNCSTGWSPGGWGQAGGNVYTYTTVGAWSAVGLAYGIYRGDSGAYTAGKSSKIHACHTSTYECYDGGATLANVPGALNRDNLNTATLLRNVLMIDPSAHQLTRHLVCAYLNALLSAKNVGFTYVLTPQQVLDLAGGVIPLPPGYNSLITFLDSTWT